MITGDSKGTTKKLCDKDLAERQVELSGAICLKTLVLMSHGPVIPSNCSENSWVLFVRFVWLCESLAPEIEDAKTAVDSD